ncbi:hypothetical protein [Halovivax limisalsi]|uniref:hypothetical protein n=1 Tax=Halovivax limisalsi TaxID=1453760 RepID=UPI001FFDD095|nr:hypothetical protein [Halovivax limisalsi]
MYYPLLDRDEFEVPLRPNLLVGLCSILYLLALAIGSHVLDDSVILRGTYPLLSLIIGGLMFIYREEMPSAELQSVRGRYTWKITLIAACLCIVVSATLGHRLIPLLVFLPIGTVLAIANITGGKYDHAIAAVAICFFIPPLTKYLATGFYFGNGDLLVHIPSIQNLLEYNNIYAIEGTYSRFPIYHLIVASVSIIAAAPVYDSVMLVGIILLPQIVFLFYYTGADVFGKKIGAYSALAIIIISPFSYYTTYFYPQLIAVIVASFLIYALYKNQSKIIKGMVALFGILLILTHHLTLVFISVVIGAVLLSTTIFGRGRSYKPAISFLFIIIAAVSYWAYAGPWFIRDLISILFAKLFTSGPSTTGKPVGGFGPFRISEGPGLSDTFLWFVTFDGIYNILFAIIVVFGILSFVYKTYDYGIDIEFVIVGVIGSLFILKTPQIFPGMYRFTLVIAIFSIFFIGYSMHGFLESTGNRVNVFAIVLMIILAVSAPLAVADDLDGLRPDEPNPTSNSFSDETNAQLTIVAEFIKNHNPPGISSMWITRTVVSERADDYSTTVLTRNSLESCEDSLFIYSQRWSGHSVKNANNQLIVDNSGLRELTETRNRVYNSGKVGGLWSFCSRV